MARGLVSASSLAGFHVLLRRGDQPGEWRPSPSWLQIRPSPGQPRVFRRVDAAGDQTRIVSGPGTSVLHRDDDGVSGLQPLCYRTPSSVGAISPMRYPAIAVDETVCLVGKSIAGRIARWGCLDATQTCQTTRTPGRRILGERSVGALLMSLGWLGAWRPCGSNWLVLSAPSRPSRPSRHDPQRARAMRDACGQRSTPGQFFFSRV